MSQIYLWRNIHTVIHMTHPHTSHILTHQIPSHIKHPHTSYTLTHHIHPHTSYTPSHITHPHTSNTLTHQTPSHIIHPYTSYTLIYNTFIIQYHHRGGCYDTRYTEGWINQHKLNLKILQSFTNFIIQKDYSMSCPSYAGSKGQCCIDRNKVTSSWRKKPISFGTD